jgi:hypothetical protein
MALPVNLLAFLLRLAPPKHKNQMIAIGIQGGDDGIGKCLPPFASVRSGLAIFNRQTVIQ